MARILVVAPVSVESTQLRSHLASGGSAVLPAVSGQEAVAAAQSMLPDVILLDWILPDMPGTEVCRALLGNEKTRQIPIVVLSPKNEEVDRVIAFELGASDYVLKPYSLRELSLRIAAILRRARPRSEENEVIETGRLRIDRPGHRVWIDGREIDLTALELSLLVALYEGRHRVQTRAALLDSVWGMDGGITTRTVDTHVKRLRDKLGPLAEYIETVRGIGYRLTVPF